MSDYSGAGSGSAVPHGSPPTGSANPPPGSHTGNGSYTAKDDLVFEFHRIKEHFSPLFVSAKKYAETQLKLTAFTAKENVRLAIVRIAAGAAGGVFLLAAWVMFSVFVYQLTRDIVPTLPWVAPLAVCLIHAVLGGAAFLYTKKLRL